VTGVEDVRRALGVAARPPALTVQCPHCRAGPGEPCVTLGRPRSKPHPGRVDAGPDATVLTFPKETRNA
jgi:hypothetical protein